MLAPLEVNINGVENMLYMTSTASSGSGSGSINGNAVAWSSAGSRGFKGSRKSTPFAAQLAAEDAAKKAMEHGMRSISVFVNGPGAGRESALRALQGGPVKVTLSDRIILNPYAAKRLARMLEKGLKEYEAKFGELKL